MALIKCRECGHDVSDKAVKCPNCGYPVEKMNVSDNHEETIENVTLKFNLQKERVESKLNKWVSIAINVLIVLLIIVDIKLIYGKIDFSDDDVKLVYSGELVELAEKENAEAQYKLGIC